MANRTPRASQGPSRPASAVPRQVQSTPSGLVACSVVIRSVASGSSSGWTDAHRCHCSPSCRMTGSLTAAVSLPGSTVRGARRRQALDGIGLQQVHPPVLGARRGAADVEPPRAVRGVHQGGPLQRLGAEVVLAELDHRGEADAVVRAGDHVGEPPPLADRAAQPVGQPPGPVHQLRRRAAGPGAGPGSSGARTTSASAQNRSAAGGPGGDVGTARGHAAAPVSGGGTPPSVHTTAVSPASMPAATPTPIPRRTHARPSAALRHRRRPQGRAPPPCTPPWRRIRSCTSRR